MPAWKGKWAGGRWYLNGRRPVYVLERRWKGERHTLTLDAPNEEEAEKQLATYLFDREAFAKRHRGTVPAASERALVIDDETIAELLADQKARGLAKDYRWGNRYYLVEWGKALAGRDVAAVATDELEALLTEWKTARKLRVVAMMCFCTFFEGKKRLDPSENPAKGLRVPKSLAARHTGAARHYTIEEVKRAYAASESQVQRDVMRLAAMTGLHTTEVERFAAGVGRIAEVSKDVSREIAGVLWVLHKSGESHPVSIDAATLAAAKRIRERGSIPNKVKRFEFCQRVAKKLSSELGQEVRPVLYGALRHSFITWARSHGGKKVTPKNFGLSLEDIRDAVGHRSTAMTNRYDGTEVPPMIVVPKLKLTHKEDPA